MDLLMSMVSIVKDINTVDKEYKNLNLQLKYTLEKATRMLNKVNTKEENFGLAVLKNTMCEGEKLSKKLDDLLNAQSIAMKDKIRLSMPFNQTKPEIIKVIETLEKVVNDFKEELSDETKVETKVESKQLGVKRKISQPQICVRTVQRQVINQLSAKQIDEHLQQVYEMGPTIKDDQYQFSQGKRKQRQIQFTVSINGSGQIMKILQNQQIAKSKTKFNQTEIPEQKNLYTVARINFQKCYAKIKAITKDIDRISTKAHFHFIFKKIGMTTVPNQLSKVSSGHNKIPKHRVSGSQKAEQDVFFSFPTDEKDNNLQFKLLAKKDDPSKTLYLKQGDEWVKVEQAQVEILNGDQLAAFLNPETKQPSIYFQLKFEVLN